MHKLELNSPAGDFASLKAAVLNGADSVYLGVKTFSARRLANNFSLDELKSAVKFAHLHGCRINLTMNTLVRNDELEIWFKTLESAYIAGIDSVIIQEISFSSLIKRFFPGLRVIASTQSSLMNHRAINSFKDIDVVVLARELNEQEIIEIRKNTEVNLEIFVHGHLCISYSGQCLISSLIGKRSGNRGICASSCRKTYNEAGYLISAKDLMLADNIGKIREIGINSIKIEGRMKSPEYVAVATKTYRKQIDELYPSKLNENQLSHLKMGFNREFTSGFFAGNKSIVGKDMPMNRGIPLGVVENRELRLESDLKVGDGIGFFYPGRSRKLEGFVLRKIFRNSVEVKSARKGEHISIPSKHFVNGSKVYITSKQIASVVDNFSKVKEMEIMIIEEAGYLEFAAGDFKVKSEIPLQEAKVHEITEEDLENELTKSFEIGIRWKTTKYSVGKKKFLPNSMVTKMRKMLEKVILDSFVPDRKSCLGALPSYNDTKFDFPARIIAKVYSLEELKDANDLEPYAIYYDIFAKDVGLAKKLCTDSKFFLDTPVVLTDADIDRINKIVDEIRPDGIAIGNFGLLDMKFNGEKHGKNSLNVFNDISLGILRGKGIIPMVSVELNAKQVMRLKNKEFIYYAYGQIPVMHFKGEFKENSLTDEKGYTFPLRIVNGNTEMLYSRPIAIYEHAKELSDAGIKYFLLDIRKDSKKIISAYSDILSGNSGDISHLKQGTTLGNFAKGVA